MSLTKYASFKVLAVEDASGTVLSGGVPDSVANPFVKQAHRHDFVYDRRPGYIYVRSRAISSRCNDNFDEFPAEEIKKAYRTFIGKPVFVNHHNSNHRRARGVILDAALHEDVNPDGTPDTWAEVLMEVDALRFPRLAEAVVAGDVARTSMGTDVAYSDCTACGNRARTPADYCQHIPKMKGMKIRRVLASGQTEDVLIAERCYGLGFFENSLLVEPPADPTAFVLGVDGVGLSAVASKSVNRLAEAAVESGLGDVLDFLRGGRDPSSQCMECGSIFRWSEAMHRFVCPEGHKTAPVLGLRKEEAMCSECNPGVGLPDHLCSPHAMLAKAKNQWGDLGPNSPYGATSISAMLAEADDLMTEAFYRSTDGQNYDKRVPGTHPKPQPTAPVSGPTMHVPHNPNDKTWGLGGDQHQHDLDAKYDLAAERERKRVQREQAARQTKVDPMVRPAHLQTVAYGETKAPAQVDTLRADRCPVCKDDEAFNGEKCSVCGHVEPPAQFRDPDLTKAKEVDLRQDNADAAAAPGEVAGPVDPALDAAQQEEPAGDLECTNCGEVFSAEGDEEAGTEGPEAEAEEADPEHPDDTEDPDVETPAEDEDLSDLADLDDEEIDESLVEDPEEDESEESGPETVGADDLSDMEIAPNMTCPICGQGTLVPATAAEEQPDVEGTGVDMTEQTAGTNPAKQARNRIIGALQEQQAEIADLKARNATLVSAVREIVVAAGVQSNPKFASLMATAEADTNNSPTGAPATTTQEAAQPDAKDDVESVGASPAAANTGVTPAAVTDVQNSNVAVDSPILDNLQDVTQPVAGTDSVVDKTHNEGEITAQSPNNDVMDPAGSSGWKSSSAQQERERFTASLRLARLQITAGLENGEDLAVAQGVFDSGRSMESIVTEADTLNRVASRTAAAQPTDAHRHLVPQARQAAAPRMASLQSATSSVVASRGEDEFMFGLDG